MERERESLESQRRQRDHPPGKEQSPARGKARVCIGVHAETRHPLPYASLKEKAGGSRKQGMLQQVGHDVLGGLGRDARAPLDRRGQGVG